MEKIKEIAELSFQQKLDSIYGKEIEVPLEDNSGVATSIDAIDDHKTLSIEENEHKDASTIAVKIYGYFEAQLSYYVEKIDLNAREGYRDYDVWIDDWTEHSVVASAYKDIYFTFSVDINKNDLIVESSFFRLDETDSLGRMQVL